MAGRVDGADVKRFQLIHIMQNIFQIGGQTLQFMILKMNARQTGDIKDIVFGYHGFKNSSREIDKAPS